MMTLLDNSWFQRVWIIQEVVVSRSVLLIQGSFSVPWESFHAAILLTWDLRIKTVVSNSFDKNIEILVFLEGSRQLVSQSKVPQLRRLLNLFRYSKATDPRDKIYALVGLSEAFTVADPSMLFYTQSIDDVYRLWTIWTLHKENNLEILSAVNRYIASGLAAKYSWVPGWYTTDENMSKHSTAWPSELFNASSSTLSTFEFRADDTVLGLSGYAFDTIEATGETMAFHPNARFFGTELLANAYASQRIWGSWESIAQVRAQQVYESTSEPMWDVYWQTIAFGEHGYRSHEKDRGRKNFNNFYSLSRKHLLPSDWIRLYLVKHVWALYFIIIMVMRALRVFRKYESSEGFEFTARCEQLGWRRMIRTRGGYIGLAVHAAKVGDKVALFKGARLPFLVRKINHGKEPAARGSDEEGWNLVGDCYVHGVMHGEAWEEDRCEPFWFY